jgi:prevent-host-death family protein
MMLPTALLPNSATVESINGAAQRRVEHRTETGERRQPVMVNGAAMTAPAAPINATMIKTPRISAMTVHLRPARSARLCSPRGSCPICLEPRLRCSTCAILTGMESVGLRELRQNASEIVRRVEAGAAVTITVSGRPVAVLRGATARSWRRYEDIADLFSGPEDPQWEHDRTLPLVLMMRAVLDTSVVIARGIPELDGELAISAATLAELHFGVLVTTDPATRAERLRRLTVLQHHFDALPVDDAVAVSYGMLAAAAKSGRQPRSRVIDLLIAATAHAHDARLYTRNSEDLKGLATYIDIVPV